MNLLKIKTTQKDDIIKQNRIINEILECIQLDKNYDLSYSQYCRLIECINKIQLNQGL